MLALLLENVKLVIDQIINLKFKKKITDYNNILDDNFFKRKKNKVQNKVPFIITNNSAQPSTGENNINNAVLDSASPSGTAWVATNANNPDKNSKSLLSSFRKKVKKFRNSGKAIGRSAK